MSETLSLPQIIERIAQLTGADEQTVSYFIREFIDSLETSLSQGQSVKLKHFGHFFATTNDIRFIADPALAEAVNQPFATFEAVELPDDISEETLAMLNAMSQPQNQEEMGEPQDQESTQVDILEVLDIPTQPYNLEAEELQEKSLSEALLEIQGANATSEAQDDEPSISTSEDTSNESSNTDTVEDSIDNSDGNSSADAIESTNEDTSESSIESDLIESDLIESDLSKSDPITIEKVEDSVPAQTNVDLSFVEETVSDNTTSTSTPTDTVQEDSVSSIPEDSTKEVEEANPNISESEVEADDSEAGAEVVSEIETETTSDALFFNLDSPVDNQVSPSTDNDNESIDFNSSSEDFAESNNSETSEELEGSIVIDEEPELQSSEVQSKPLETPSSIKSTDTPSQESNDWESLSEEDTLTNSDEDSSAVVDEDSENTYTDQTKDKAPSRPDSYIVVENGRGIYGVTEDDNPSCYIRGIDEYTYDDQPNSQDELAYDEETAAESIEDAISDLTDDLTETHEGNQPSEKEEESEDEVVDEGGEEIEEVEEYSNPDLVSETETQDQEVESPDQEIESQDQQVDSEEDEVSEGNQYQEEEHPQEKAPDNNDIDPKENDIDPKEGQGFRPLSDDYNPEDDIEDVQDEESNAESNDYLGLKAHRFGHTTSGNRVILDDKEPAHSESLDDSIEENVSDEDDTEDAFEEARIRPWLRWVIGIAIAILIICGCFYLLSISGYNVMSFLGSKEPVVAERTTEGPISDQSLGAEELDATLLDETTISVEDTQLSESVLPEETIEEPATVNENVEDLDASAVEAQEKAKREEEEKAKRQEEERRLAQERERVEAERKAQERRAQPTVDRRFANGPIQDVISPNRTLASMAADYYGSSHYWVYIYQENPYLGNPQQIMTGTKVNIPPLSKYVKGSPKDPKNIQKAIELAESINSVYNN